MERFIFTSIVRTLGLIMLKSVNDFRINTICDKQRRRHKKAAYLSIAALEKSNIHHYRMIRVDPALNKSSFI
jgi:hypothetical protein